MLYREGNPTSNPVAISSSGWNLPSVRDLLHPVSAHYDAPRREPSSSPSFCPACLSKNMKVVLGRDGACPHCCAQRYPVQRPEQARSQNPGANLSFYKSGNDYQENYPSHRSRPHPIDTASPALGSILTPLLSPLYTPLATASSSPSYPIHSSLKPQHHLIHHASLPNLNSRQTTSFSLQRTSPIPSGQATTTANKLASANRHKLSEKHRRDEQGAFITAGHVLCSGMDPGVMAGCRICIAQSQESSASANLSFSSSFTESSPLPSSSNASQCDTRNTATATQQQGKPKIAKNIMLEDGLMWQFSMIIHLAPNSVADRLEVLRALARTMEMEKQAGIGRKVSAGLGPAEKVGKKNWDADVRGEKLLGLIARMEEMCASHNVSYGSWDEVKMEEDVDIGVGRLGLGKRRRTTDSAENELMSAEKEDRFAKRRFGDVPTPPSSTGSPQLVPTEDEEYR